MPTYHAKHLIFVFVAVFSLGLSTLELSAQVEKRVVFAKGKYSATYKGRLPRDYADYDAYIFRARRGQTLSIKLTTADPNAYVAIYETQEFGPDEDTILANNEYARIWSGKLPITSEYSVQIYGVRLSDGQRSTRAPYTIEITIR